MILRLLLLAVWLLSWAASAFAFLSSIQGGADVIGVADVVLVVGLAIHGTIALGAGCVCDHVRRLEALLQKPKP